MERLETTLWMPDVSRAPGVVRARVTPGRACRPAAVDGLPNDEAGGVPGEAPPRPARPH